MPARAGLARLRPHWPLLLLLTITLLAYAPLWDVAFSWDDEALIADNQMTGDLGNWKAFFLQDLWSTTRLSTLKSGYYRPLMLLSLAVDRALFGLHSGEAHLHSLIWHLLAVGTLYGLVNRLLGRNPAVLAATVFALHPVQSEVMALVAARNDSMAATFVLGALWLLVDRDGRWPRLLGAGLLALLALLSKESAVLAPLMLLALDLARFRRPGGWQRYGALIAALLVYLPLRRLADLDAAIAPTAESLRLVTEHTGQILGTYAGLLVWPWPLTPARHVHYLAPFADTLPGLVAALSLFTLAVAKGKDRGLVIAGGAWALLTFVPSLAATFDKGLLGERYLYLPVAGLSLSLVAALPRIPLASPLILALPAFLALQVRLPAWKNSQTVWSDAHAVAPTAFTAGGLAWYHHRDGDYTQANTLFIMALEGEPPYRDVCEMIVMSLLEARQAQEAVRVGRWALTERGCPADGMLLNHYAVALAGVGSFEEAARVATQHPRGLNGPGVAVVGAWQAVQGNLDGLAQAAARMPDDPSFLTRVAKLLALGGRADLAAQVRALPSPAGGGAPR